MNVIMCYNKRGVFNACVLVKTFQNDLTIRFTSLISFHNSHLGLIIVIYDVTSNAVG